MASTRLMWVATRFGEACDRFLLSGPDGSSPSDEKRQALEAAMAEHRLRQPAPALPAAPS